jgi:hypothetical protein
LVLAEVVAADMIQLQQQPEQQVEMAEELYLLSPAQLTFPVQELLLPMPPMEH